MSHFVAKRNYTRFLRSKHSLGYSSFEAWKWFTWVSVKFGHWSHKIKKVDGWIIFWNIYDQSGILSCVTKGCVYVYSLPNWFYYNFPTSLYWNTVSTVQLAIIPEGCGEQPITYHSAVSLWRKSYPVGFLTVSHRMVWRGELAGEFVS